jgi:hypothetical protein
MTKTKALPAANVVQMTDEFDNIDQVDSTMQIRLSSSDPDRAIIKLTKPVALPDGHNICIDMGRRFMKIAYWRDSQTIIIDKLPTELAEVPAANSVGSASKSKFLAKNQAKVATKNRVSITYLDKTYTAALRAQKLGGSRGLGEKKTVNLLPRVLCALTLHGVKQGQVNLILTIPFEGASDWATQEEKAAQIVDGQRVWKSDAGVHDVQISTAVVPESFYAEKFPRLSSSDFPDWDEIDHHVFDFGYQTFLKSTFVFDPIMQASSFDPDLSECHDGYGLNLYYKYAAIDCGYGEENAEDPAFIEAVNREDEVFVCHKGRFPLSNAITTASDRYLKEILKLANPSPNIVHFQVVGGGAYRFGQAFCDHFEYAESFVTDLPDLANIIGQAISLPNEFNS